ncbi:MAG TPA: ATP-binding protein, partial [Actinomycetota bacterium]|nr:ATP-binding protein [Actinomycetota bacterium]
AESRRIVWGLRPPELEELGFVEVLRRGAVDLGSARGVEVDVRVGPEGVFLASEEEPMVLLILQEALNNAIKHAGARSICIDIGSEGNAFVATVADDGAGFDATGVNWGIGLISMRERADVLGGTLEIVSRPEGGTIVRLRLADSRLVGTPAREA